MPSWVVLTLYATVVAVVTADNTRVNSQIHPFTGTNPTSLKDGGKLDLVFIIDESESVDGLEFQLIKNALKRITDPSVVTISQTDTRVAWVGFSTQPYTEADQVQLLKDSLSNSQTSAAIDRLTYHPGGCNAASAFEYARDTLLTAANGARKDPTNVTQLVILISSGDYKTWDHPVSASSIAIPLRTGSDNLTIYAVAFMESGRFIDKANLLAITGYEDHTYMTPNYSTLADTIKEIVSAQTCEKPNTGCQADLILVVDRSLSVDDANFMAVWNKLKLKMFLAEDFTTLFPVDGDNQYRFAMVTFSDDVKVEFHLGEQTNNADVASRIHTIGYYHPAATNTAGALNAVLNDVLNPANYKPIAGSGTVVIVFTDGIHNFGGDPKVLADQLRTGPTHATIVSVGIGPVVAESELISISGSKDLFYLYGDFTHLGNHFVDFVNSISCKTATTTK